MKETHKAFFFYQGELVCMRYTNSDTPEALFKNQIEGFFRYACERRGFRSQLACYDLAFRGCVSDLEKGLRLSKKENHMLVMAYMVLWKFGKLPYEDIIILKRKRKKKIISI
jgi:hypothetical protein